MRSHDSAGREPAATGGAPAGGDPLARTMETAHPAAAPPPDVAVKSAVAVEPGITDPAMPMAPAPAPHIRPLERGECEALLRRNMVGRIAFSFDRKVDVLPIHYVYDDGWLYGRTSPGSKIAVWRHSHWVAFEVDEVRSLFDWSSVVVHGGLYMLDPGASDRAATAWEHAVTLLRRLVPGTGTVHDPVPHRTIVFRIHADVIEGRVAVPPPPPA